MPSTCVGWVVRAIVSFGYDSTPGASGLFLLRGTHVVVNTARVDLDGEHQARQPVAVH
jgi:hypothetical protein